MSESAPTTYTIEFSTYDAHEAGEIYRLVESNCARHGFSGVLSQNRDDGDRGFSDLGVLPCRSGRMSESERTKYRLLVYRLDDKLALAIPLSDDQACALGDALHLDILDGTDLRGEHPIPHVHFEVSDG